MEPKLPKLFYLGSAITNVEKAGKLIAALTKLGWTCTFDWTAVFSMEREDNISDKERGEIARQEVSAVMDADIMVLYLPGGRGAHVELGASLASRVPVLLIYNEEKHLQGGYGYGCIFYHHELVHHLHFLTEDPDPQYVASLMEGILRARDEAIASFITDGPGGD